MKVLLRTPLSPYTGYGSDGIGLAQALMRWGADVYIQPTGIEVPLPKDVLTLFEKDPQAPFDLYINHVDPMSLGVSEGARQASELCVAWTMWEYTNLDNMAAGARRSLRRRLKPFDLLLGYSGVDIDCFTPYFKGPIAVRQGGFDPSIWPYVERDWNEENFYFCMIGVLSGRKAPMTAVKAFIELREEDEEFAKHARLSLKTTAPGLHSAMEDAYPGLRIFYDIWPQNIVREFYANNHVLLAPSRGEGKNMPALEFMSTGGVVIATNWAGHTQWLHPSYNYPLNYTLEVDEIYRPTTMNASVDVEDLKAKMLHVFKNRDEAKQKGDLASQIIPANHSWDHVVEDFFDKIRDNVPEKGQRLWDLAQYAYMDAHRGG